MQRLGFSTGALAKGDFARGVALQQTSTTTAVELSALRENELPSLIEKWRDLDLSRFEYVSVHAPGKLANGDAALLDHLAALPEAWPVVAHPEVLKTEDEWRRLGPRLCIENMDMRKTTGRTTEELRALFDRFPDARFCLDLGHTRQVDPTMATALRMIHEFSDRLVQIHISEVGPLGEHLPISAFAAAELRLVTPRVPQDCAVIIESMLTEVQIARELRVVQSLFTARETDHFSIAEAAAAF